MSDPPPTPSFGPMHPVTRLGRVVQQLRSFGDLHAAELEGLAAELSAAELEDLASKVRVFAGLQRDEAQIVVDEIVDVQHELAEADPPQAEEPADGPAWLASPKRAAWLAEQTRPRSRREFFHPG